MNVVDMSSAANATPVPPPRIKKKHKHSLSLDQANSHSEPNSPILPRAKPAPAPPPRPKVARTSSSDLQDYYQHKNPRLKAHTKVEKRPSTSAPFRPPPPAPKITVKAADSSKLTASRISSVPPTSIPPRPRSSLAKVSTEKSNARISPVASEQHFHTNPRPHKNKKKKSVERPTSQLDVTSVNNNSNKLESIYRNVAPRLPPNAHRKSNSQNSPTIINSKLAGNKATSHSSPASKNKVKPQRPPHPPPRYKPSPLYEEIKDNYTDDPGYNSDPEYCYISVPKPRIRPASSRPLEGLDLELRQGQDNGLYVNNDYKGPPSLRTHSSLSTPGYAPILTHRMDEEDVYTDPRQCSPEKILQNYTVTNGEQRALGTNEYQLSPSRQTHMSGYTSLLTHSMDKEDVYTKLQQKCSSENEYAVVYDSPRIHSNKTSEIVITEDEHYTTLSTQTQDEHSFYQLPAVASQT